MLEHSIVIEEFKNDEMAHEFVITIHRETYTESWMNEYIL